MTIQATWMYHYHFIVLALLDCTPSSAPQYQARNARYKTHPFLPLAAARKKVMCDLCQMPKFKIARNKLKMSFAKLNPLLERALLRVRPIVISLDIICSLSLSARLHLYVDIVPLSLSLPKTLLARHNFDHHTTDLPKNPQSSLLPQKVINMVTISINIPIPILASLH